MASIRITKTAIICVLLLSFVIFLLTRIGGSGEGESNTDQNDYVQIDVDQSTQQTTPQPNNHETHRNTPVSNHDDGGSKATTTGGPKHEIHHIPHGNSHLQPIPPYPKLHEVCW